MKDLIEEGMRLIGAFDSWQRELFELQYRMTQVVLIAQSEGQL